MRRALLALLLLVPALLAAAEPLVTEVVPLRHRLASEVLPMLRDLVVAEGAVTGMQNQLVIRSTPANLAELKRVLASLDTRQQMLRITVRQNTQTASQAAADALAARARIGGAEAGLGGPGDAPGAAIRYEGGDVGASVESYRTHGQDDRASTHFVNALEGTPAFIGTGQSVPLPSTSAVLTPYGANVQQSLDYRAVGSGVYVTPRLAGDEVTLEISPYDQRLDRRMVGAIEERGANAVVRGRLGEWLPLGGASSASHDQRASMLSTTTQAGNTAYDVWVKVELVP